MARRIDRRAEIKIGIAGGSPEISMTFATSQEADNFARMANDHQDGGFELVARGKEIKQKLYLHVEGLNPDNPNPHVMTPEIVGRGYRKFYNGRNVKDAWFGLKDIAQRASVNLICSDIEGRDFSELVVARSRAERAAVRDWEGNDQGMWDACDVRAVWNGFRDVAADIGFKPKDFEEVEAILKARLYDRGLEIDPVTFAVTDLQGNLHRAKVTDEGAPISLREGGDFKLPAGYYDCYMVPKELKKRINASEEFWFKKPDAWTGGEVGSGDLMPFQPSADDMIQVGSEEDIARDITTIGNGDVRGWKNIRVVTNDAHISSLQIFVNNDGSQKPQLVIVNRDSDRFGEGPFLQDNSAFIGALQEKFEVSVGRSDHVLIQSEEFRLRRAAGNTQGGNQACGIYASCGIVRSFENPAPTNPGSALEVYGVEAATPQHALEEQNAYLMYTYSKAVEWDRMHEGQQGPFKKEENILMVPAVRVDDLREAAELPGIVPRQGYAAARAGRPFMAEEESKEEEGFGYESDVDPETEALIRAKEEEERRLDEENLARALAASTVHAAVPDEQVPVDWEAEVFGEEDDPDLVAAFAASAAEAETVVGGLGFGVEEEFAALDTAPEIDEETAALIRAQNEREQEEVDRQEARDLAIAALASRNEEQVARRSAALGDAPEARAEDLRDIARQEEIFERQADEQEVMDIEEAKRESLEERPRRPSTALEGGVQVEPVSAAAQKGKGAGCCVIA